MVHSLEKNALDPARTDRGRDGFPLARRRHGDALGRFAAAVIEGPAGTADNRHPQAPAPLPGGELTTHLSNAEGGGNRNRNVRKTVGGGVDSRRPGPAGTEFSLASGALLSYTQTRRRILLPFPGRVPPRACRPFRDEPMSQPTTDRNLLFGILALQMDFVPRDDLLAALNAWVLDKGRPLGQILCDRGVLAVAHRALLDSLVEEHLKLHGSNARHSLAAICSTRLAPRDL